MAEPLPSPADLLPHRGVALVLDELIELTPGVSASGLWTPGNFYYEGHFPIDPEDAENTDRRVLPGHWTEESIRLIGACPMLAQFPGQVALFREGHFKAQKQVMPGTTLEVWASFPDGPKKSVVQGRTIIRASGKGGAMVDGKTVYQARLLSAVIEVGSTTE